MFDISVPCSGGITHVNPQDKSEFTVNFKVRYFCFQKGSVVDRHRVDADPDPTFRFDADPDPDRHENNADPNADPIPSFHMLENRAKFSYFYDIKTSLKYFSFLVSGKCVMNLSILDSILKFS